jgi:hypothetical protein
MAILLKIYTKCIDGQHGIAKRRIEEDCSCSRVSGRLTRTPGQAVHAVTKADRRQCLPDSRLPPQQAVQAREVLQVLGHRQLLVQPPETPA